MLVPAGLEMVGGLAGLHEQLQPAMFAMTAAAGMDEGDPWFVLAMSALGLAGVVVQPHVMTATASGRAETDARVGMTYGNFIKRLLTIAWAFTGLIAVAAFPDVVAGHAPGSEELKHASETLFGRAIQKFLGDGWRGLMIACLVAGVTSAETFMVVRLGHFHAQFLHPRGPRPQRSALLVGRAPGFGGHAGLEHPDGVLRRQRDATGDRLGPGGGAARRRILAGRRLAASQRGRRVGQLRRQPAGVGTDYGLDRTRGPTCRRWADSARLSWRRATH